MRHNYTDGYLHGRGHVITTSLLLLAMCGIMATSVITFVQSRFDSEARTHAAEKEVLPPMTSDEFVVAVDQLAEQSKSLRSPDFATYFALLKQSRLLSKVGAHLDREYGVRDVRGAYMQLNAIERNFVNAYQPEFLRDPASGEIMESAAFKTAQNSSSELDQQIAARTTPTPETYAWSSQLKHGALSLAFCLPFALLGLGFQMKRETGASWGYVGMGFISDWRLLASVPLGPLSMAVCHVLFRNGDPLQVNPRNLAFALTSLITLGGGGVGVAKAQPTDTGGAKKKATIGYSLTERVESDSSGTTATTMLGLTYKPTGSSAEAILVKGNGFSRNYGLYVQKLATWQGKHSSASVSSIAGVMTFSAGNGTAVYAVAGARVGISHRRFAWNTPHLAVEQPLTRNVARTSAVITKPSFRLTKRVTIVNEWFARFTERAKPKVTGYLLANIKLWKRFSFETGPYRTNSGLTGMRFQFGYSN